MTEMIALNGTKFIVDNDVAAEMAGANWSASVVNRGKRYVTGYDSRLSKSPLYLHRLIVGALPGETVDHINGNSLDNRKENLRLATSSQNAMNAHKRAGTKSKYKGVSFNQNLWRSGIYLNGKRIDLGYFKNEIDAARAYDQKALELFGEFARPNNV
jgi:hypothetical protein